MTPNVISVGPDTTVDAIANTLISNGISALPVIDKDCRLLGIVSEGDLIRRSELKTAPSRSWWLDLFTPDCTLAGEFVKSRGIKARDVMTRNVLTVPTGASLQNIAETLEQHGIKRVPVMENDRVVGIVSRANLIQALASLRKRDLDVDRSDEGLRREISMVLEATPWGRRPISIIVNKAAVDLWGTVGSAEEKQAARVAAEATPGVAVVRDHLRVAPGLLTQFSEALDASFDRY